MFRKAILAAALLLASLPLVGAPATAANLNIKDGNSTAQVLCAISMSDGSLSECNILVDTTGTKIDPATKQLQQSEISILGTPAQAGGKIDTVINGSATDIGVAIAANAATQLVAANPTRRGFAIQNQTSGVCYLNGVTTATADYHSMLILSGVTYESKDSHVGTGPLSLLCASAGGIYARQW